MLGEDEPLLISGRVDRPVVRYTGWGFIVGGLLGSAFLLIVVTGPWGLGIGPLGIALALMPAAVMAAVGAPFLTADSASRRRPESFALTPQAIGHRIEPGQWEPLMYLSEIRRVEAGAQDNVRFAAYRDAGATLEVVDDQHRTHLIGPVHNPVRWTRLIAQLCAEKGTTIETFVHRWVAVWNPPES